MENLKSIILIFLMSNYISVAQNKTIVPTTGTIVFVKKDSIIDQKLYLQSYRDLKPKIIKAFKEEIYLERLTDGKATDTVQLNKMANEYISLFEFTILEKEDRIFKYHATYDNDLIIKFFEVDGQQYKTLKINTKTNSMIDENGQLFDYYDTQTEILNLKEFRSETKIINGYKCFKIIGEYKIDFESDFDILSTITINKREMWVTESIKSICHPLINNIEILEKYYPMQMIEYKDEIKGFQTIYTLDFFSLK